MLLTHLFDGEVLFVRLPDDLAVDTRGTAVSEFEFLLRCYRPRSVLMELPCPAGAAAVSTVLRAERLCRATGASFGTTTSRAAPALAAEDDTAAAA
ncbi:MULTISPECIES: hypothetical protein [unclassified Streptomyces]|uniref:hypothetical protein n=1 Tax=unclassified Streptomyces TaxID=2593676 RepID=UPI0029A37520|nr:hypothetical protein [Streptomyces sp. DK15]MDX2395637.1 hypothetical protein [Streptomyces sp. DK15]